MENGSAEIRYIGCYVWQEWFDVVRSLAPSLLPEEEVVDLVKGFPGPNHCVQSRAVIDANKAALILGVSYRTKEETTRDILVQAVKEGWL